MRGLRLDSSQLLEYMRALQIPDRGGRMHFQEVLYALPLTLTLPLTLPLTLTLT